MSVRACATGVSDAEPLPEAAALDDGQTLDRLHRGALHFRRVEATPTSSSGKVDYHAMQSWVVDVEAGSPQLSGVLADTPAPAPKETR